MWLRLWEEYLFHVIAVMLAVLGVILAIVGIPFFPDGDGGRPGWGICLIPLGALIITSLHVRASRKRDEKLRQAR